MGRRPVQSGTECGAIVAGSRLDIDLIKESRPHQLSVRCAIEGDTTGQRETANTGSPLKMTTDVQHRHVKPFLECSRKIMMAGRDFFITLPPRAKLLFQETASRRVIVSLFPSAVHPQCR